MVRLTTSTGNIITVRTLLLALTSLVLFIICYFPVIKVLVNKWLTLEEYSHAFLTLPILAYMVWFNRAALGGHKVCYSSLGIVLLLISTPFYIFALLTNVHTILFLAMLATTISVVIYLWGIKMVWILFTPLLLLTLLIPVPEQLIVQVTLPLQLMVTKISEAIIQGIDVPVFREGNILSIPDKRFEVAEACSGLRSLITLVTLSIIMAYFFLQKNLSKIVLVAVSVPTAILLNVIRILLMVLLFHYFRLDLSQGFWHTVEGIFAFSIAMVMLFLFNRVIKWCEAQFKENSCP
jgi:exosortase